MTLEFVVLQHGTKYHLSEDSKIKCPECREEIDLQKKSPSVLVDESEYVNIMFHCKSCGCIFTRKKTNDKEKAK